MPPYGSLVPPNLLDAKIDVPSRPYLLQPLLHIHRNLLILCGVRNLIPAAPSLHKDDGNTRNRARAPPYRPSSVNHVEDGRERRLPVLTTLAVANDKVAISSFGLRLGENEILER